jgi:hypothetical protein
MLKTITVVPRALLAAVTRIKGALGKKTLYLIGKERESGLSIITAHCHGLLNYK